MLLNLSIGKIVKPECITHDYPRRVSVLDPTTLSVVGVHSDQQSLFTILRDLWIESTGMRTIVIPLNAVPVIPAGQMTKNILMKIGTTIALTRAGYDPISNTHAEAAHRARVSHWRRPWYYFNTLLPSKWPPRRLNPLNKLFDEQSGGRAM